MNDDRVYCGTAEQTLRLDDSMFWRWRFVFWLHGAGYVATWGNYYGTVYIVPANSSPGTVPFTFAPSVDRIREIVIAAGHGFLTELSNYFTEQTVDSLP